jgi:hypothetical protein
MLNKIPMEEEKIIESRNFSEEMSESAKMTEFEL